MENEARAWSGASSGAPEHVAEGQEPVGDALCEEGAAPSRGSPQGQGAAEQSTVQSRNATVQGVVSLDSSSAAAALGKP